MAPSPANMYADLLRHDLYAFIHRSFLELNAQTQFLSNWHIEVLAAKLEEVRRGSCKRLIVNVPPRHLKSHAISIAFPAWILGHEPTKQILSVTYAHFGEDVGDARTTEFLHRDSHPFAVRIRGLSRLCSTRDIITVTKRPEDTGPIRVSAKSQIGASPIS